MRKPDTEQGLWNVLRPVLNDGVRSKAWRIEDKLAVGRPDVQYRLAISGCDNTGVIELKHHRVAKSEPFWSKLEQAQSVQLQDWGEFNRGKAWLLMGIGSTWFMYFWNNPVVVNHRARRTAEEFARLANNRGQMDKPGLERLFQYLVDVHLGRT